MAGRVAAAWRPYVDGQIENWSLPVDHDGMLSGSALLDIGEVVGGALIES
ncbi:hypothetical protein NN3_16550 [Nocardia neocaledoniensis NBRC 108232]|uniref:Uncharacterized protein n=1 Tax=Nocardia neocaledoniensis TaxID=236511 RepID=A0A317NM76_9NOCA|nr:hypothetical protein [Nocardia neocaledoniensis]PWV76012.1 hypothetical protein DFR69_104114 [Nocardia neocaledoniensis]GEM30648.1 hypothetical protein NN3_16550 [Nocardia neocaledoniensis NBRC 108232]